MMKQSKRIGVIGWPVRHSLSPLIHNHWLAESENPPLDCQYEKIAVQPDQLPLFLASLVKNNFLGINITLPHKHCAYKLVADMGGEIDELARLAQSINTIAVQDNGNIQACSTDGKGFWANLKQAVPDWQSDGAVVLFGAGGAAAALACALTLQGVAQWRLVNRTPAHAEKLAALVRHMNPNININIIDWAQRHRALEGASLLIQATSLGMSGKPDLNLDLGPLPKSAPVADIVYQPVMTSLLTQATAKGHQVIDGLGMLIHQAVPAFELWFAKTPKITKMLRQKLERALS